MSLAHSLTEFHCGRLFYRQTPDGLNQFVLMLPEQQEDSFQTTAGKEKAEIVTLAETGKSVILIVEDQMICAISSPANWRKHIKC